METTLVILKPDAIQRGLTGRIISRFERKGLRMVGAKLMQVTRDMAERHYAEHAGKPFYESLLDFITASPVMVLAVRGNNGSVAIVRKLVGATAGAEADPGTIRGDLAVSNCFNLVHASDSPESAKRELDLWFDAADLIDWELTQQNWIDPQ